MIKRLPCKSKCQWTGDIDFGGQCPFLLHSLYPYFLGLLYGAKEMQDIWACCPAEKSVNVIIHCDFIDLSRNLRNIYAEVVEVEGKCPHGYDIGVKIYFPTFLKAAYICPAGINNIFPFLDLEIPPCINKKKLRCPDWKEDIYYEVKK
jgi:hypothetical protein